MCGIAGLIHKNGSKDVGTEMTAMLSSMEHRGPDSTGFALYGKANEGQFVLRYKTAEQQEASSGFDIVAKIKSRKEAVMKRLEELNAKIHSQEDTTDYAGKCVFSFDGDLKRLVDYLEDIDSVEILSIGKSLELIKDLGNADRVAESYSLNGFMGSHAIGHTRMATESDVDIRSAHPYWAYPFKDIAVVHNGQLTNYWSMRRQLERLGHRFTSNCDSEMIAVYVADKLNKGMELEEVLRQSIEELDGVFTYLVATEDSLGVAKDCMAAKPLVLMETDDMIAMASEEIAIVSAVGREIDSYDPYESTVKVWKKN